MPEGFPDSCIDRTARIVIRRYNQGAFRRFCEPFTNRFEPFLPVTDFMNGILAFRAYPVRAQSHRFAG